VESTLQTPSKTMLLIQMENQKEDMEPFSSKTHLVQARQLVGKLRTFQHTRMNYKVPLPNLEVRV